MTTAILQQKIVHLETELTLIKQMTAQDINFDIDETNWKKIKSSAKSVRKRLYQERYGKK